MKTSLKTLKPSHLALAAALAFGGASAYAADAAPAATKPVPGANADVQTQARKQTEGGKSGSGWLANATQR
ncbi:MULTISPECIES: hypothetical protein [unclassified Tepidimonas]|jgi:Spy/CpxP family protein refolding chaperone|uniref:hypothetical protein n=1 Tax=unclassified Tepidimonas TaxID=2631705 RepID=UPI002635454A|nr:hypothetical protein [uncultured Tepidimonas sp.]